MAEITAFPRSRPTSMSSQKSASPVNRTFLKSSLKKPSEPSAKDSSSNPSASQSSQSSQHKPFAQKLRLKPFPLSNIKAPDWFSNFRASKTGAYMLQYLDILRRWFLRYIFKFFLAALVYTGLIFLIAKDNAITSRNNLVYISDVLKVAGGFSETVEDGYLVDDIPRSLRDAETVLRNFFHENIEHDDPFAWPVHALLAEVETIVFGWESFRESKDEAVLNIKEQVKSSRSVFQDELNRLREIGSKNRNGTSWKRLGKRILLDDPCESRVHFDAKNFANITGSIQDYISTWRATSIPQLSYRLTATERGPTGALLGKMEEVRGKWPKKRAWSDWGYKDAPVDGLEEVREKAISLLKREDAIYGGFLSAIHLLDLGAEKEKRRGFGEEDLEELMGVFNETIRRLQEAEFDIWERHVGRTYPT